MDLKEQRQLHYEQSYQKVINTGRLLSSMSAWVRASLGPGGVEMVIVDPDPIQLAYCLCLQRQADLRSLNSFAM